MKFYDIDPALREAVEVADKPVRLQIKIDREGGVLGFLRLLQKY